MATFSQTPEKGRPPDSPTSATGLKLLNRKSSSKSTWHSNPNDKHSPYLCSNSNPLPRNFDGNEFFEVETKLTEDLNKNVQVAVKKMEKTSLKQSLPKLLCLTKSPVRFNKRETTNINAMKTLNVKTLSMDNYEYDEYMKKSASGYLNNSNSVNDQCDNSTNTSSQFCNNSRIENSKKSRNSFHQNVEEALNSLLWQPYEYQGTTRNSPSISPFSSYSSPSSSYNDLEELTKNDGTSEPCSFRDLHLQSSTSDSEMVINLREPIVTHQSQRVFTSHDPRTIRSTTRLSDVFSLTEIASQRVSRVDVYGDSDVNFCDMQVSVPLNSSCAPEIDASPVPICDNGVNNSVTTQTIFQNINETNLSTANVVGLPNHARYSSVPVSTIQTRATNSSTLVPKHSRNISEPSNQFFKCQNNVFGSQTTSSNIYRHTTQIDHPNVQQINTFRSTSVPKNVPVIPRHESTTVTTTTTVPSTFINNSRFSQKINTQVSNDVSNVNVNFYRAVPVNVISSVPTIHCLNTLSNVQGNEVSNVQVLPLGNPPSLVSTTSSLVVGTTQVILHNTQASIGNIDRPNLSGLQNSSTSTNTSTNTNAVNNFYPQTSTNQVIIQNKPSHCTTVPFVNNQPILRTNVQVESNVQASPVRQQGNENRSTTRTFTSTEAQTDEISILPPTNEQPTTSRENRRRERRERRHQRRLNNRYSVDSSTHVNNQNDRLPDLLNSHLPPPYSPVTGSSGPNIGSVSPMSPLMANSGILPHPHGTVLPTVVPSNIVSPSGFVFQGPPPVGQVPLVQGPAPVAVPPPTGFRFPFPATGFRRGRFSEDPPKGCCGFLSWKPGSLRWFIALIALVAVCCVLVGTALGAMRPSGRDHLTVSLLMIGVGIVLVTVSGVAWRLTSHDSSTCRSMLGLGSTESVEVCPRRFVPRLPPAYGRPHHPYAAMMYPEFQYRPPPPSYQASMQEYRLRLLLLERGNTPQIHNGIQNAISPPPTYRSQSGSLLRAPVSNRRDAQSEYSCPPSYRSQSTRPGTIQSNSVLHSREQSLSLSESNHGGSMVNVVNILSSTEEDIALDNITLDSLKMEPENDLNPVKMLLKGSSGDLEGSKDGNLVTIVQTSDQSPVIVTVSGSSQIDSNNSVQITEIPSGMEILAHL
ncbi:uncharacterized protein LOC130445133 [Diorhabda sublineata]|uniref:uncharacterized protein LOC130445133 n=1 Tax=Diorhabda sublineata TaxID=1163346 RepID=UPI0024E13EFF|nr:uncharacterized protein LOC130445133 [Diorhabda sublineata]XP_056636629.1 uncharacterized protein LOC130445133 [Diorhabda sublineata]XP_056636631.1 uncharacterized protein LOC130445133 [Diorhabda sublineata]XP_056636632.1 uncharacterized protein LOC130445133 [Diorhabda sublineata]